MTNVPETGARKMESIYDAGFWSVYVVGIRTLFYSKPESGVHVTEMMTYDWSMIIAYVLMCFLIVL